MSYDALPRVNGRFLPDNVEIARRNPQTGALQELLLDERYSIAVYDPDIQTPDVQERYIDYGPLHLAITALMAAGVKLPTIHDVFTVPKDDPRGAFTSLPSAAWAVGSMYHEGLLQSRLIKGREPNIQFQPREVGVLDMLTKGRLHEKDFASWGVLDRLYNRHNGEGTVLTLVTKAMATDLMPEAPAEDIKYARLRNPLARGFPERPPFLVDPNKLFLRKYIDKDLKTDRNNFVKSLSKGAIDLSPESKPRTVTWRGADFTFNFNSKLSPARELALSLHILGLDDKEIAPLIVGGQVVKKLLYEAKLELGIPVDVEPALFCAAAGYMVHRGHTDLPEGSIHAENLKLFRHYVETNEFPDDSDPDYWRQALRYAYGALGGTNRQEAVLAAMTHGYIRASNRHLQGTRVGRKEGRTKLYAHGQGMELETEATKKERRFEDRLTSELKKYLKPTVEWRRASVTFNFMDRLSEDASAVAIARSFGLERRHTEEILVETNNLEAIYEELREVTGEDHTSAQMAYYFNQGYIKEIDVTDFQKKEIALSSVQQQVVEMLGTLSAPEAQGRLGMSAARYFSIARSLYAKYEVPDYSRLVWAAVANGHVPALAHLLKNDRHKNYHTL